MSGAPATFDVSAERAARLDAEDPFAGWAERFHRPRAQSGEPAVYLCGNSLGLQPKAAADRVREELDAWARLAVDAHFEAERPWYAYHEEFRETGARLVGARPGEVVMMNSLTVNLHLMLVSFYRPTPERPRILIEDPVFPSDLYAVRSQLAFHGLDPDDALLVARPRPGEATLREEDVEALLDREGDRVATMLLGGVNFLTGQALDIERLTRAARARGVVAGWDLAHAAGNLVLRLHDWGVDFAVWCSYKYLNAGPGAVAGCFVHERHAERVDLPRFAGWWGNDPRTRFRMQLEDRFVPRAGADGWQLSNPPILAMAPLLASLELFDRAGMPALRAKSERLTAELAAWVRRAGDRVRCITPDDPARRGCQLSLAVERGGRELFDALHREGVVTDFREPDVIRMAPAPLYTSFADVRRAGLALERCAS